MKWIGHLLGAAIAGIICIVIWEFYSGVSISKAVEGLFASMGVGTGLMVAILAMLGLVVWFKSSRG